MPSSSMSQGAGALAILGLVSVVLLWVSLRLRRRERLIRDLPNSKVQGVFIGLVELKVTAEAEKPLTSFLAGESCVQYAYTVDEHWSRTVTETYTDDKGQSQTRDKVEEGWTTVAKGGAAQPFYGRDETGIILIRPEGATFEAVNFFDHAATVADPIYHAKGPLVAIRDSTGRRRFKEEWIPLHAPLFIVGQAREREDIVAPEIASGKDVALFLISAKSQELVQVKYSVYSWLALLGGLVFAVAAGHFGRDVAHPPHARLLGAASLLGAAFLAAWATGWAWMVFNSLVGLRARVRQGWSLIDVELKRRHDLIPGLVGAVAALGGHESSVQTAVAALRAQLSATRTGEPGADFAGIAGTVRAVAEKYPSLVAQEGFSRLQKQLVETEQRIALARTYYNDIATHFATRVSQIPDAWLAAVGGIRAEPLLAAADFERAPVNVSLSGAR